MSIRSGAPSQGERRARVGAITAAYFNPAVTLAAATEERTQWREAPAFIATDVSGA